MIRTAFGRLLLMPTGHLALTRFIILLSYLGPPPSPTFLLPLPSSLPFRLFFRPILFSCFYLGNARAIYLFVFPSRSAFLTLVRGIATVKFDLLGLRTTSRRKRILRDSREHLLKADRLKKKKMSIRKSHCIKREYTSRGITFSNFLLDKTAHYLSSSFNSCRNSCNAWNQSALLRNAVK